MWNPGNPSLSVLCYSWHMYYIYIHYKPHKKNVKSFIVNQHCPIQSMAFEPSRCAYSTLKCAACITCMLALEDLA